MVGALVRHISDKADEIKSSQERGQTSAKRELRKGLSRSHSTSNHQIGSAMKQANKLFSPSTHRQFSVEDSDALMKSPFLTPFSVNESQIVQCARDLLVLCNRTQSGGDTYFCVDALLRGGEDAKELTILTPYSASAEPLHFQVDIVQVNKLKSHNSFVNHNSPGRTNRHTLSRSVAKSADKNNLLPSGRLSANNSTSKPFIHSSSTSIEERTRAMMIQAHSMSSDENIYSVDSPHTPEMILPNVAGTRFSPKASSLSMSADFIDEGKDIFTLSYSHSQSNAASPQVLSAATNHYHAKLPASLQLDPNQVSTVPAKSSPTGSTGSKGSTNKSKGGLQRTTSNIKSVNSKPPLSSTKSSAAKAQLELDEDEVPSKKSPANPRRPQLDLKAELEKDGYMLGITSRSPSNNSPRQPVLVLPDDSVGAETEVHMNTSPTSTQPRTVPLYSSTSKESQHVSQSEPTRAQQTKQTSSSDQFNSHQSSVRPMSDIIPEQVYMHNNKDDTSVISELTFDTYHKHVYQSTSNQITHSMQTNKAPNSSNRLLSAAMTNNYLQNPGMEEDNDAPTPIGLMSENDGDATNEESVDDNASDPSGATFQRKKKSLLKQLSKKLKPFRIPEGFDGIASPFRPKRSDSKAEYPADYTKPPELGISRQRSSSAPPIEERAEFPKSMEKQKRPSKTGIGYLGGLLGSASRDVTDPRIAIKAKDEMEHDGIDIFDEIGGNNYCIRVQVEANSRYKICSTNPTGIEEEDCWATVTGTFFQSFYIVGDGSGLLGIADRLVTIEVDNCRLGSS